MAKCPNCQNDIKDDFGLVTCSNCGAQVLLSMDGPVESLSTAPQAAANLETALGTELLNEIQDADADAKHSADALLTENQIEAQTLPPVPDFVPGRVAIDFSPQEKPQPTTPDMGDVADFGNSSASLAREGSLRFNIFLSGIDTIDIRNQVQEALTDERFLWDAEALVSRSKNGEMRLTDVSAVKSSIIIQRLRSVPIDVRWEQHAIHQ